MRIAVIGSFIQASCWRVERLPMPGETVAAESLSVEPGGKGLNVAIGARRLGADVDLLLGIGSDTAGDDLLNVIHKEGLSSDHVWRLAPRSGHGAGLIAANGQNAIAVYPGPNLLLSLDHIRSFESSLIEANLVYGQLETALSAVTWAFRYARNHGVRTVLNPSPWQTLPKELLNCTDVLIVNETEARELLSIPEQLTGSLNDSATLIGLFLDSFLAKWPGSTLVITLGDQGSLAFERNGSRHSAPAVAINAVDCTGSGDAYASAFCIALCQKTPLHEALHFANAAGALMASRSGVLDALPTYEQLSALIRSGA